MNIYQRINAVMKEIAYVKRGSAGQGTGVIYDVLISEIRESMVKNGIVVTAEKSGKSHWKEFDKGNNKKINIYCSDFKISYINIDDPKDKVVSIVESHAMDSGDKAPGKAITYATKISMLKVFSLETGENDESRVEDQDVSLISPDKAAELESKMVEEVNGQLQWSGKGKALLRKYKIGAPNQLKTKKLAAFEKDLGL